MSYQSAHNLSAFLVALVVGSCAVDASEVDDAEVALRTGRYDDAIAQFEAQLDAGTSDPRAARGLARSLATVGRYGEAEEMLQEFQEAHSTAIEVAGTLGEILYRQGKIEAARQAFEGAIASGASDRLTAQVNLGILLYENGEHEAAEERFARLIVAYNQSDHLTAVQLAAVGTACRYLGTSDPQLYKDALKAYDEAIAADPSDLEPRLRVGELFLEKYNSTEARRSLEAVLQINPNHPRALLAVARLHDFEGSPEALEVAQKTLELNPNLVAARVFVAQLRLKLEQYEEAAEEAHRALAVNPQSLEALSVLAAAHYLQEDEAGFEAAHKRALHRNPRYAELYNVLADACVYNRLYAEAAAFAAQAVALDPRSYRGYGLLGLNELRLGKIEAGKAHLETSFTGDPYNVWIKNTLDLVDTFVNYRETVSPRFSIWVDATESDLLGPYLAALAEEAFDALAERYRYQPPTPIRLEVYPSHADFSVRTVGLAGLGALGVSFGSVLALDSPSARAVGSFNWGSTLWHELAHTFTLGSTNHKIPRWLTEGISVYEEHRARPGWGDDVRPEFLLAFKAGKLLGLAEFNNGFIRPSFPEQIAFSYYQAALVCELIEKEHGHQALLRLLAGYRDGKSTEVIFQEVLDTDLESFDKKLNGYIEKRFGAALEALGELEEDEDAPPLSIESLAERAQENPGEFRSQMAYGLALFREDKLDEALPYLERARDLFPQYAGEASPYVFLAEIYKQKGKLEQAAQELAQLTSIDETHYEAHLELADLRKELEDDVGEADALERMLYIYPLRIPIHTRLAQLYEDLRDWPRVIRERQAVVALAPVDRADALYRLALAYLAAGQPDGARRQVLRALEVAPGFEEAQELLLEIHAAATGSTSPAEGSEEES